MIKIFECEQCKELKHIRNFKDKSQICKNCSRNKETFTKIDRIELIKEILRFKEKLK